MDKYKDTVSIECLNKVAYGLLFDTKIDDLDLI